MTSKDGPEMPSDEKDRLSVQDDGIESRTGAPEYFFCTKCGTHGTEQECKCGYLALGPFPNWKARADSYLALLEEAQKAIHRIFRLANDPEMNNAEARTQIRSVTRSITSSIRTQLEGK